MRRVVRSPITALLLAAGLCGLSPPAVADKSFAQHAYEHMLNAISLDAYEAFVEYGDPVFRSLRREEFEKAYAHFGPLLAKGQRSTYLGSFRRAGMTIHYWRISFNGEGDDWLAKLAVHESRVRGFFISPP